MSAPQHSIPVDSADESHAQERAYFAFSTMRAYLDELEAYARDHELFREAACAMVESQSRQLGSLLRVYERALENRSAPRKYSRPSHERVL